MAYGAAISGRNSRKEGNVSWINGDGKEIINFQAKDSVTYLNCNNTGTIIGCNKTYYGLKIGGRAFWEYTATKDMTDVLLMENVNNVLFATNDNAVILNMDTVSQDTTVKEEKENKQNTEKVIRKQKDEEQNADGENQQDGENQNAEDQNNENQEEQNNENQQDNQNEEKEGDTDEEQKDNEQNENTEGAENNENKQNQKSEVKQNEKKETKKNQKNEAKQDES